MTKQRLTFDPPNSGHAVLARRIARWTLNLDGQPIAQVSRYDMERLEAFLRSEKYDGYSAIPLTPGLSAELIANTEKRIRAAKENANDTMG